MTSQISPPLCQTSPPSARATAFACSSSISHRPNFLHQPLSKERLEGRGLNFPRQTRSTVITIPETPNHSSQKLNSFKAFKPFLRLCLIILSTCAPLKTYDCGGITRPKFLSLYWNFGRGGKGILQTRSVQTFNGSQLQGRIREADFQTSGEGASL
jgi:hypothetical protein